MSTSRTTRSAAAKTLGAIENSLADNSAAGKKTPTYSASPASCINVERLASTRFIVTNERKYPFRDALGRVNLHLVNSSLAEAEVDGDQPSCDRLRAWQRHAVRNLAKRPADELATLDELADESDSENGCLPSEERDVPQTVPGMRRRLFRAPQPRDEPLFEDYDSSSVEADRFYRFQLASEGERKEERKAVAMTRQDSSDSSGSDASHDDDVWEVEAILDEDELGGKGFLIRWAGFSPAHDSWEPEWNVAPHLVDEFRKERGLARAHVGDDYMNGRKRLLWCASCCCHRASDSFSAQQRRNLPSVRSCLIHHYKGSAGKAARDAAVGGSPVKAAAAAAITTATPERSSAVAGQKRPRDSSERGAPPSSRRSLAPPPAPNKAARPVAFALSQRQAALEMRTARLFGFGSF